MRPIIQSKIHPDTEKVVTDGAAAYSYTIPKDKHEERAHNAELRDDGFITGTRSIESAFSLFKRAIVGSYHKMSRDHMDSYLSEPAGASIAATCNRNCSIWRCITSESASRLHSRN